MSIKKFNVLLLRCLESLKSQTTYARKSMKNYEIHKYLWKHITQILKYINTMQTMKIHKNVYKTIQFY